MKTKTTLSLLVIIAVIAFSACKKQAGNQKTVNGNAPPAQEGAAGGAAATGDKFLFRGTIASLSIEMSLVRDGGRLSGAYFYPRVGKNITLAGTVDQSGNVELTETDESGNQTGVFKGKWETDKDSPDPSLFAIEGKWSKPDGSKSTDFYVSQQPIAFTSIERVFPKVIRENNKDQHYTVEVEYPEIQGDARFAGFNREARNLVTKDVAAFKAAETSEDVDTSQLPEETRKSTIDMRYEFRYATDSLISVGFTESTYSRGAAHPNSLTTVLNYDVKNNRKLALTDLSTARNYLSVIANYCLKELKDRQKKDPDSMLADDMIESGASARADNYNAWAITKKGLWITFDPYQVAPYAAGPQYVLVPYPVLKEIVKADGLIGGMS